jgi:transposase
MLVQKDKRWRLPFPFERKVTLQKKNLAQSVLSVDLGLTTTAVCSAILADGTVTHREFMTYGGEKDRLGGYCGADRGEVGPDLSHR